MSLLSIYVRDRGVTDDYYSKSMIKSIVKRPSKYLDGKVNTGNRFW